MQFVGEVIEKADDYIRVEIPGIKIAGVNHVTTRVRVRAPVFERVEKL